MGRKIQLQYKWQMTEKVRLFLFLKIFFILIFFYKHYKICIEASLINIVFGKGPIFSLSLSPFFSLLMKLCQAKKKKKKTLPGLEHSQVVWVMESSTEKKEEEKGKKNALMILCQDGYYNSFSAKPALKKKEHFVWQGFKCSYRACKQKQRPLLDGVVESQQTCQHCD